MMSPCFVSLAKLQEVITKEIFVVLHSVTWAVNSELTCSDPAVHWWNRAAVFWLFQLHTLFKHLMASVWTGCLYICFSCSQECAPADRRVVFAVIVPSAAQLEKHTASVFISVVAARSVPTPPEAIYRCLPVKIIGIIPSLPVLNYRPVAFWIMRAVWLRSDRIMEGFYTCEPFYPDCRDFYCCPWRKHVI